MYFYLPAMFGFLAIARPEERPLRERQPTRRLFLSPGRTIAGNCSSSGNCSCVLYIHKCMHVEPKYLGLVKAVLFDDVAGLGLGCSVLEPNPPSGFRAGLCF